MKKRAGFALVEGLIALTILTVLAVGGYVVWQRGDVDTTQPQSTPTITEESPNPTDTPDNVSPTVAPTQTSQPTATPTPDPTTKWTSYETAHYLFKYPTDWREVPTGSVPGCGPVFAPENGGSYWLTICGVDINNKKIQDLDEDLWNKGEDVRVGNHSALRIIDDKQTGTKQITYWVEGVSSNVTYGDRQNGPVTTTGLLRIYFYSNEQDSLTTLLPKLNQILSTFQFTD